MFKDYINVYNKCKNVTEFVKLISKQYKRNINTIKRDYYRIRHELKLKEVLIRNSVDVTNTVPDKFDFLINDHAIDGRLRKFKLEDMIKAGTKLDIDRLKKEGFTEMESIKIMELIKHEERN